MLKYWLLLMVSVTVVSTYETVYAVSYGEVENNHTDSLGIFYKNSKKDCTYATNWDAAIKNIPTGDVPLYQGYCVIFDDNSTNIPVSGPGHYLLVLKFRTGYIIKVDVMLNKQHFILRNFDAMNSTATDDTFDVTAVFTVCGDHLIFNNEISTIINKNIELAFKFSSVEYYQRLAAIGLFKDSNEKELPVSLATNVFRGNDWSQQTFSCSFLQFLEQLKQPIITNNYYYNTYNFKFPFDKNVKKDLLVRDEFY